MPVLSFTISTNMGNTSPMPLTMNCIEMDRTINPISLVMASLIPYHREQSIGVDHQR